MTLNRLVISFLISLCLCFNAFGAEYIESFEEKNLSVLNDELRDIDRRIRENTEVTVDSVTGVLPLSKGGTGSNLVDPDADRIGFWDDSAGIFTWLTPGSNLTVTDTTLNAAASNGLSNAIYSWNGCDTQRNGVGGYGLYHGTSGTEDMSLGGGVAINFIYLIADGTTERTLLTSQYEHDAGFSTVKIHAKLWSKSTGGTNEAILKVDIGGQNSTVKSVTSITPTWYESGTDIDVSGLTPGTKYTISIILYNENGSTESYCSGIILTVS